MRPPRQLLAASLLVLGPLAAPALAAGAPPPPQIPARCAAQHWETGTVETEPGVTLFFRRGGSGPPVVVAGDFLLFDHLCALAEDHSLLFYDMRNRGRSSRVEEGERLTLAADVRDLEAMRRHHGLAEVSLVGYSYLGKLMILYALEHAERVTRVVQLGPVPMDPARTFPPELAARYPLPPAEVAALRAARDEGLHRADPAEYCRREWKVTAPRLVGDPRHVARLRSRCELPNEWPVRLAFHMEHHFLRSAMATVVTPIEASRVAVPVMTIHGTLDRNAPYGGGREWAASLPEGRLLTVEGAAHASFVEVDLLPALRTFLSGAWPDGALPVSPAADGERSRLEAWDLLRRARELHGGDGAPPAGALALELAGELYPRSQSRTAEPPYDPFPVRQRVLLDPAGERLEIVEELEWPNFVARRRTVVAPQASFDQDLATGAVRPPWRAPDDTLRRTSRLLPPLLLDEILAESAGSLRFAGLRLVDGEPLQVVEGTHRGERVDLLLAEDGTLAGLGRSTEEPMLGDVYESLRFAGRIEAGGWLLPSEVRREVAGAGVASRVDLRSASWRQVDDGAFAPPAGAGAPTPGADAGASRPEAGGFLELASGIALAWTAAHPDYRSLVVERADHLVLVEAPLDSATAGDLLALLERRYPGKPVRWLVATHHHYDHAGGVPAALAATGATLVTTPGNERFFRRAVTAPRTLSEATAAPGRAEILTLEVPHALPGGPPEVVVVPLGPTDHVDEILAVHLPAERILFQGDFARFPLAEHELYRPDAKTLSRRIRQLGLDVERIAGVHGEVGTPADLPAADP